MIPTSRHFQHNAGFDDKSEGTVTPQGSVKPDGYRIDVNFEDIENYFKERGRLDAEVSKI